MRGPLLLVGFLLLVLVSGASAATVPHAGPPLEITPSSPLAGATVHTTMPVIRANFTDNVSTVDTSQVSIVVDGTDVTTADQTVITTTSVTYTPPQILQLPAGNHTVVVTAVDHAGNHAQTSWGFFVNTTAPPVSSLPQVKPLALVVYIGIGAGLAAAGFGGYIFYLKQTRRFTFRKYFATHQVKKQYWTLYIPGVAAFVFVLGGLLFVFGSTGLPLLAPDYVFVGAMFVGLTAFAIDARREKQKVRLYERAFAQFLFEMADAMRGGIDPAKAITELSKTTSNVMAKPLRIAADGIRLGRPFDVVLKDLAAPMKSSLIARYAVLIADASAVGGETSAVVYRAAKDMDDFIKIEVERNKELVLPVAILYIAFGVLLAVLFALLYIAPSLGAINVSFLSGSPLPAGGGSGPVSGATVPRISFSTLKERFFDLMVINSLGTGVIIGAFTEGKARYGLVHSLTLVGGTVVAFVIVFP